MTLTLGRAPFGHQPGSFDAALPGRVAYVEAWPRRMRARFAGATVLDSRAGQVLYQTGQSPVFLFPAGDLARDLLVEDGPGSWTVAVGGRSAPGAIRSGPALDGPAGRQAAGLVVIDYHAMDRWFEDDDPVYAHPRDPYHRVDVRSSSQHVAVRLGELVIAETVRPKLLYETGLPVRYYLPFADVRTELLTLSTTVSECPYKGDGQHWDILGGQRQLVARDAAWSLPHPLAEAAAAIEHISFYPHIAEVTADGDRVEG